MRTNLIFSFPAMIFPLLLCSLVPSWGNDEIAVQQLSANGTRSLRPFIVQDQWELRWDLKGQSIEIYLKYPNGEAVALTPMASQKKPGAGATFYPKGGTYYLRILADGDWTVNVVQLGKAQPTPQELFNTNPAPKTPAQSILPLHDFSTSISRYGSLFAIFTIENSGDEDVRDFTIACATYGESGTQIGTVSKTFYDIVVAKSNREYEGVEIGPVNPQTNKVRCQASTSNVGRR